MTTVPAKDHLAAAVTASMEPKHRRGFKLHRPTRSEFHIWLLRAGFGTSLMVFGFSLGILSQR